jgi:hypothetical protein
LQRLVPHVGKSVAALAEKWRAMASAGVSGEVEVDVEEWFQAVTEEVITRTTFGRSYDDGRVVYAMQSQLMAHASETFRKVLVPGYRYAALSVSFCGATDGENLFTALLQIHKFAPMSLMHAERTT